MELEWKNTGLLLSAAERQALLQLWGLQAWDCLLVKNWEKAISSLYAEDIIDIYLTGSNSYLLSSDIATLLYGRYVMIKVLPLSFQEYLEFMVWQQQEADHQYNSLRRMPRSFMDQEENLALDLKRYVRYGSLPYHCYLKNVD